VHLAHGEFPLGEHGEHRLSDEACRADDGDVVSLSHSVSLILLCMSVGGSRADPYVQLRDYAGMRPLK
jgi:hypothetical protein